MRAKETYLEKLERAGREIEEELKLKGEEFIRSRLQKEEWERFLPELVVFAKQEIRRRKWLGQWSGVLPEGADAESIAAEVIGRVLGGKVRLALGWTYERLQGVLQRLVCHEVRRLHKLAESRAVRSEWEVLPPDKNNEPRSVFDQMPGKDTGAMDEKLLEERAQEEKAEEERKAAEERIAEALRGEDELMSRLFSCLREGVKKRREIAPRLGISVEAVTNCQKRLNRKLKELAKRDPGVPQWVITELKQD